MFYRICATLQTQLTPISSVVSKYTNQYSKCEKNVFVVHFCRRSYVNNCNISNWRAFL